MSDPNVVVRLLVEGEARDNLGLSIDMLDVDRLRDWARLLLVHGADISHWGSLPHVVSRMQLLATNLARAIRDIGVLRAELVAPAVSASVHKDVGWPADYLYAILREFKLATDCACGDPSDIRSVVLSRLNELAILKAAARSGSDTPTEQPVTCPRYVECGCGALAKGRDHCACGAEKQQHQGAASDPLEVVIANLTRELELERAAHQYTIEMERRCGHILMRMNQCVTVSEGSSLLAEVERLAAAVSGPEPSRDEEQ